MKNGFAILLIAIAAIAALALTGCKDNGKPAGTGSETESPQSGTQTTGTTSETTTEPASDSTQTETIIPASPKDVGFGEMDFLFQVTDSDGNTFSWNVHTDETTIGAALVELGLIEGEAGQYGLFVETVNGITVTGGAYWAFYIDGEYAVTGVDSTDIEEGFTYALVYTKA